MIRTQSIVLNLGAPNGVKNANPTQIVVSIGWNDPNQGLLRSKMNMNLAAAMERFRVRMNLLQGKFTLEDMCQFLQNDAVAPDRVHIMDGTNGAGAEWTNPSPPTPPAPEVVA